MPAGRTDAILTAKNQDWSATNTSHFHVLALFSIRSLFAEICNILPYFVIFI